VTRRTSKSSSSRHTAGGRFYFLLIAYPVLTLKDKDYTALLKHDFGALFWTHGPIHGDGAWSSAGLEEMS
jgi:hypothetical protein